MRGHTSDSALVGPPSVPRTPGAWVALSAPVAIAWAIWPPPLRAALALIVALVCLLLAQHASVALPERETPDARWWIALELVVAGVCGSFLVIQCHKVDLLVIGAVGTALWGVRRWQMAGNRLADGWMLALSGPAACVVSDRGSAACLTLFFGAAAVLSLSAFWRQRAPGWGKKGAPRVR
ncbi:MAG: hypothetical protein HY898_31675 [Deltaproteobacteria bacterium]|nr:hypothetical protein [Deltaproteobacteria bacterium]